MVESSLRESERQVRRKLDSVLSPEGDGGDLDLADCVQAAEVQAMMDCFYALARVPMSIIDLQGKVVVGVGWQEVCTRFHRVHPETLRHCIESDTRLSAGVSPGEFRLYKCKNNMWDISTPIVIGGRHVGNIFSGQFFFEDEVLDIELFRSQARRYGFDEEEYFAALRAVPRLGRKTVETAMAFFVRLAHLLSGLSYSNVRLARSVSERDKLNRMLKALSSSNQAMMRARSESEYLGEVCRIVVEDCGYAMVWIGFAEEDEKKTVRPVAQAGFDEGYLATLDITWADRERGRGPTGTSIRERRPCSCQNMLTDPAFAPWRKEALKRGYASSIALPLMIDGHAVGAITVYSRKPAPFSSDEVSLLEELAADLSLGITRIRSVEALRRSEEAFRQAKAEADQANRAKDHFLAVLSHELRTPLTPVLTTAQVMEADPRLGGEHREAVTMIRRNVELESRLIDDLLDLTRISRGKVQLHFTTVEVHEKVSHVARACDADLRGKQIELTLDLRADDDRVQADPGRLQQCFWNLLKNAIKFTPVGGRIRIETANAPGGKIAIAFGDTGIGIEPERLGRIFDAFYQGGEDVTRLFGGLGLGLSITRGLVELHGGTISARSPGKGRGSTFTIEFPLSLRPAPARREAVGPEEPAGAPARLGILLVEDHADTRNVMARLLGSMGHEVVTAGDVASGLKAAGARPFDLVISDIGLPDGSGLDLIRQLSAGRAVKSIALSGYGHEEDVRKSREAGFTEHLTKPVDLRVLKGTIDRLARD